MVNAKVRMMTMSNFIRDETQSIFYKVIQQGLYIKYCFCNFDCYRGLIDLETGAAVCDEIISMIPVDITFAFTKSKYQGNNSPGKWILYKNCGLPIVFRSDDGYIVYDKYIHSWDFDVKYKITNQTEFEIFDCHAIVNNQQPPKHFHD